MGRTPEDGVINAHRQSPDGALRHHRKADAALAALKEYWDKLLSHFTISSSEKKLDRMVNVWAPVSVYGYPST